MYFFMTHSILGGECKDYVLLYDSQLLVYSNLLRCLEFYLIYLFFVDYKSSGASTLGTTPQNHGDLVGCLFSKPCVFALSPAIMQGCMGGFGCTNIPVQYILFTHIQGCFGDISILEYIYIHFIYPKLRVFIIIVLYLCPLFGNLISPYNKEYPKLRIDEVYIYTLHLS